MLEVTLQTSLSLNEFKYYHTKHIRIHLQDLDVS